MSTRYSRSAIRRLRKAKGAGPSHLAKAAKITPQGLRLLEQGKSEPRVSTLARIADSLGVPIASFFEER